MKCVAILLLLALSPSTRAANVYDSPSDDGMPGGVASVPTDGSQTVLNLYIDGGPDESAGSDKCTGNGSGDELCAWDVEIDVAGGMAIDDFTPGSGVVANAGAAQLRANGLDAFNPSAGPQRIGTLTVSSIGDGDLFLRGGLAVRSDLQGDGLGVAQLASTQVQTDTDGDGVPDNADNCILDANADQRDSNGDGFGNVCDADLNNDLVINVIDLGLLRTVFFTADPDADFNGDSVVNVIDLGIMKNQFFGAPGPSGIQN